MSFIAQFPDNTPATVVPMYDGKASGQKQVRRPAGKRNRPYSRGFRVGHLHLYLTVLFKNTGNKTGRRKYCIKWPQCLLPDFCLKNPPVAFCPVFLFFQVFLFPHRKFATAILLVVKAVFRQ